VLSDLGRGDVHGALGHFRTAAARVPGLAESEVCSPVREELSEALLGAFATMQRLDEAVPLAAAARAASFSGALRLTALVDALVAAAGRPLRAATADELLAATAAAGAAGLQRAASELAAGASARRGELERARQLGAGGQLDAAGAALREMLICDPANESVRRELDLVEQGQRELDRRLDGAREAARSGRLREACTLALSLTGSVRVAADAQQLVVEVQGRMRLVDRGLDEVRVALHGRLAAGVEGVRHCLRRLQELAKVQVDHEQLPEVISAVEAEIEALCVCERATEVLGRGSIEEAAAALGELQSLSQRLLTHDRLEARVLAFADQLIASGDAALAAGRLAEVEQCAVLFDELRPRRDEFERRAARLRGDAEQRRCAAAGLVERAAECLDRRDLAEAERLCEQAQVQWAEGSSVRRLAADIGRVRTQQEAIERVEHLAAERDYAGAHRRLATMPPTEPMLRTRIYDMKQNLLRAQGLEGAFLLRVDEGGEHVVLRGDSVSIGNVRQTRCDLPVLANLAGRHASIRRSMSFHGGMQDTVVAEEGEVRVRGQCVASHKLAPGDKVLLGASLSFAYRRPSGRSLSASLVLQGGFQVAGTDRIVLMKDRGRDGRILIGPGADAHVRVPSARGEVEVFANNTGQIRVHSDGGGTIDKVPFRGEHPLAAGQLVEAAGITFVLLPWHPQA
jgi:hypothetical protein